MNECDICCLKFSKTKYKIICPSCDETACSKCCERYILEIDDDPHCMYCSKTWNKQFLIDNFTKTFIRKRYNEKRKRLLFDREKALFPITLENIEIENKIKRLQDEISEIRKKEYNIYSIRRSHRREILSLENNNKFKLKKNKSYNYRIRLKKVSDHEKEICRKMIKKNTKIIDEQKKNIQELKNENINLLEDLRSISRQRNKLFEKIIELGGENKKTKKERYKFNYKCPVENCKGVLNDEYKCVLCENNICKKCYIPINEQEEHECKKDDIDTFNLLKKQTKPCPRCNTLIYRIEGCPQMFCTNCKTFFCWNTGRIITNEYLHNPEYFKFLDNGGTREEIYGQKQIDQINNCGNLNYNSIRVMFKYNRHQVKLGEYVRKSTHITQVEIPKYDYDIVNNNEVNRKLYLRNLIDENKLKQKLVNNERKQEKYILYTDLLNVFSSGIKQIFRKYKEIYDELPEEYYSNFKRLSDEDINKMLEELEQLSTFIDECFLKISKDYNCVKLRIATF